MGRKVGVSRRNVLSGREPDPRSALIPNVPADNLGLQILIYRLLKLRHTLLILQPSPSLGGLLIRRSHDPLVAYTSLLDPAVVLLSDGARPIKLLADVRVENGEESVLKLGRRRGTERGRERRKVLWQSEDIWKRGTQKSDARQTWQESRRTYSAGAGASFCRSPSS